MKALILSSQGHQKEAFALAKVALNNNMKSHVCWHVYGILYRTDKNYDESIKAYKFALKLDPESQPIQRDLANLQIHMRDYPGYIQSRQNMLQQRPAFRQNWTALAIAHHLAGNYKEAENVLTTYEDTLKHRVSRSDTEHWEAMLYKNSIIAESGDLEKALDHLEAVGKRSPDVLGVMELKADYLLKLHRKADAEGAYAALLERNPENSEYYDGWLKAKEIGHNDEVAVKQAYDQWVEKFPKADAPRRRPLDSLQGEQFREAVDSYLQRMLRKGVPSLFANIKHLYVDSAKRAAIEELVKGYRDGSLSSQRNGVEKQANGTSNRFEESVYYFLAQHYNYRLSRNLSEALVCSDKAIELAPESVDPYMTKARTLKYLGNIPKAAEVMDKARTLDTRDRCINSKCAKYQLRNDENDKALGTMGKFTRNETAGGPLGDLHDMQCIWYITEDGKSHLRQRKLGLALKRFHSALTIFDGWHEDQFDFHHFSLRKGMIRAYIDMLRWEDNLRGHPFFLQMAIPAIEAYVLLHDVPDLAHGPMINGVNGSGGDLNGENAERKRAIKKAKKEQQRLEKADTEKKEALRTSKGNAKPADGDTKKEDADPFGKTLVETKVPLEDAMKFLGPLLEFSPESLEAQFAGFEVFIRRSEYILEHCLEQADNSIEKYLLALKTLHAAKALVPSHPTLHYQIFRFRRAIDDLPESISPKAKEVILQDAQSLCPKGSNVAAWNDIYLKENHSSAAHVQSALRVRFAMTGGKSRSEDEKMLKTALSEGVTLPQAAAGLELLEEWHSHESTKSEYRDAAQKFWPEASVFHSR